MPQYKLFHSPDRNSSISNSIVRMQLHILSVAIGRSSHNVCPTWQQLMYAVRILSIEILLFLSGE